MSKVVAYRRTGSKLQTCDVEAGALPRYVTLRRGRSSTASVQTTPLVDRHADSGTSSLSSDGQVVVHEPTTARILDDQCKPTLSTDRRLRGSHLANARSSTVSAVCHQLPASNRRSSARHPSANAGKFEDEFESEVQEAKIVPVKSKFDCEADSKGRAEIC